ncbi:hypothetical protein BGX27_005712, partial [Mortierella sp. AM989]
MLQPHPTLEKVDNSMNDLRIEDNDVDMEHRTPTLSDEDLIETSRLAIKKLRVEAQAKGFQALRIENNDAATTEELASLPSLELEIKALDNKIQRLETRLQQITKLSASPVIKPPVASSSSSEHTERKLVLDDIIPRYG